MHYLKPIFIFNNLLKQYNIILINTSQLCYFARNKSLSKNYLFLLTILTIVISSSCSVTGYKSISDTKDINVAAIQIFDDNFTKAIYKTDINIYSNNLTGITVVKKLDSSIRVVSMSEMGMKYFDFEFPGNQQKEPIVHYIMEPLNKKLLVNMIKKDFELLLYIPKIDESKVMINDKSELIIKHNKMIYFIDNSADICDIKKYRVFQKPKQVVALRGYNHSYPDTISIAHGKIFLNFVNLKQ